MFDIFDSAARQFRLKIEAEETERLRAIKARNDALARNAAIVVDAIARRLGLDLEAGMRMPSGGILFQHQEYVSDVTMTRLVAIEPERDRDGTEGFFIGKIACVLAGSGFATQQSNILLRQDGYRPKAIVWTPTHRNELPDGTTNVPNSLVEIDDLTEPFWRELRTGIGLRLRSMCESAYSEIEFRRKRKAEAESEKSLLSPLNVVKQTAAESLVDLIREIAGGRDYEE